MNNETTTLKIVSDGTLDGSKVVDTNTNKTIDGVSGVEICFDAKTQMWIAHITIMDIKLDIKNGVSEANT